MCFVTEEERQVHNVHGGNSACKTTEEGRPGFDSAHADCFWDLLVGEKLCRWEQLDRQLTARFLLNDLVECGSVLPQRVVFR